MSDTSTESQPPNDFSESLGESSSEEQPTTQRRTANVTHGTVFNVIVPLALLALGVLAVIAFGSVKPKARPGDDRTLAGRMRALPPVRVTRLATLDPNTTPLRLEVDGNVVPYRESRVAAEIAGRIVYKSEHCEAGVFVNKGQVLMRIDDTDYKLEVERLTRLKEQEYQALVEIDQEVANTQRLIDVAKRDVKLQEQDVDRKSKLPDGFSSQGEVDQAKRSLLQATQQLVGYENQKGLLGKRRLRLEAAERLAATQLKAAEINLERTEIAAPIDGVIASEDADLNTFVARGNLLVTIEDTSKVEVATNLRMDQLYWILNQSEQSAEPIDGDGYQLPKTPAEIEYELTGREGAVYSWQGHLLGYDGIGLDPTTRTVPVRVLVDQPQSFRDEKGDAHNASGPSALVRGMYVRVKLFIKPRTPLVVIPGGALKPGNRVWQFIPDDSVLALTDSQESGENVGSENPAEAAAEQEMVESADDTPLFDPELWSAGRVVVRRSIIPIDSLRVNPPDPNDENTDSRIAQDERFWVCEVRDQVFNGDSFVVVSPLASVDNDNMPARASAEVIAGGKQSVAAAHRVAASTQESTE